NGVRNGQALLVRGLGSGGHHELRVDEDERTGAGTVARGAGDGDGDDPQEVADLGGRKTAAAGVRSHRLNEVRHDLCDAGISGGTGPGRPAQEWVRHADDRAHPPPVTQSPTLRGDPTRLSRSIRMPCSTREALALARAPWSEHPPGRRRWSTTRRRGNPPPLAPWLCRPRCHRPASPGRFLRSEEHMSE